jgi:hypothetical protein
MSSQLDTLRAKWRHLVVHCQKKKYDVYIGRPSAGAPRGDACKWGNPFPMRNQSDKERERVSNQYREWIYGNIELTGEARRELRGKVLGCWCDPKYCHGHILAEIANSSPDDIETDVQSCNIPSLSKEDDCTCTDKADMTFPDVRKQKGKPKSQLEQYLGADATVFTRAHNMAQTKQRAEPAPVSGSVLSVSPLPPPPPAAAPAAAHRANSIIMTQS